MKTECIITFLDSKDGVFCPGQLLSCKAVLTTYEVKNRVKEISMTVSGSANTSWSESKSSVSRIRKTTRYSGEEVYFSSQNIVQKDPSNQIFDLMPGTYTYDFQMQLPAVIPTSFIGYYGRIHYEVKCTISRSWKFNNVFIKPFTIICPLDLNHIPILRELVDVCDEKTTICCCFKMSPLKLRAIIPISGFVPGQSIPCTVEASNESVLSCSGIMVALYRHVLYTATFPSTKTKLQINRLSKVSLPEVLRYSKKVFIAVLMVPTTSPSSLDTCAIISTIYMVTVEAKVDRCHRNLKINLPVTIGTVPLIEKVPNSTDQMDNPNPISELSADPPTYEDAQEMNQQTNKFGQDVNIKYEPFAPKYPVYKNIGKSQEEYETNCGGQVFYATIPLAYID